jgi:cytochrome d ubiquinol oxidase subunit II
MTLVFAAGALVFAALTAYALLAGADFGGGVWDLFASGPRAKAQRALITDAIGPVWEANHVWLILAIVVIWTCFPAAYARIGIGLHVPLTLLLVGIVLRGTAFVFRSYDTQRDDVHRRWSTIFAVASVISPVMLGVCVGAMASGGLAADPQTGAPLAGFVAPWLAPFPLTIGAFTLALFAWLAAVYLAVEAKDPEVREDFRRRGLLAGAVAGALAFLALGLGFSGAPEVIGALLGSWWSLPFQALTGLTAGGALYALFKRRFRWARALTMLQVVWVINGWGISQYPYIIVPDLTIHDPRAPDLVIGMVLALVGGGSLALVPTFAWMYWVFKRDALR